MNNGILIEAKGKYSQFINQKTGEFFGWWTGKDTFISQAKRQIAASEGAKIEWYFAEESTKNAVSKLFAEEGIQGIDLIFKSAVE